MTRQPKIFVRELESKDIPLIANYWFTAEPDFLESMGADKYKLPDPANFTKMLSAQLNFPNEKKSAYALIWELDGKAVGHSNVNQIVFGKQATMHLHLWNNDNRKRGIGTTLVKKSLPFYFDNLNLEVLFCEPYALNPAPNNVLKKVGFEFVKKYTTIPGSINFEQEVNRWKLSKRQFDKLKNNDPAM